MPSGSRQEAHPPRLALSLVIRSQESPGRVLIVRRPEDDPELPGAWGLPAGRPRDGEPLGETIRRIGLEKLGVHLEPGQVLGRGSIERRRYRLDMELVEARLIDTRPPVVPQAIPGITQYTAWRWGIESDLAPAASLGSLCCRLFLESVGHEY